MTTIAAVCLGGEVAIGADRRMTVGNRIYPTDEKCAAKGAAVIAASGWGVYATRWLRQAPEYCPKNEPTLTPRAYAERVADSIQGWAKERGAPGPTQQGAPTNTGCWLLVATFGHLFTVSADGSVHERQRIATEGSGEGWAMGCLHAMLNSVEPGAGPDTHAPLFMWVREAIGCASTYDSGTGNGHVIFVIAENEVRMASRKEQ